MLAVLPRDLFLFSRQQDFNTRGKYDVFTIR